MFILGIPCLDTRLDTGQPWFGWFPRRAGVARLEDSFVTRLPVAGYTRGAVASGAPGASRCWGVRQGTRSGGVGWAVACTGFGVAGCRAPAWSGWVGGCYRRGTAPATGCRDTRLPVGGLVQLFLAVFARL